MWKSQHNCAGIARILIFIAEAAVLNRDYNRVLWQMCPSLRRSNWKWDASAS